MDRHPDAPDAPGAREPAALTVLAGRLPALAPSCGPVRLVAVDGPAGSGKSTFAGRLAAALGGAPVVHLDDVATHEEFFGWPDRLRAALLEPLARGAAGSVPVYDWTARRFGPPAGVPAAPVVLLEGVGAGRAALRPFLAAVMWLTTGRAESRRRGLLRDGPELAGFWRCWTAAEDEHFRADPTLPYADWLVRQVPGGYEVLPGPAGRPTAD